MNNCIFTTHHTLDEKHAEMSIRSLFDQTERLVWDNFVVYNTHEDELSNDFIVNLLIPYINSGLIENASVFEYKSGMYPKTLTQDTINHFDIILGNEIYRPGKTLLLKSDYCVSRNFNETMRKMKVSNNIWSLPIYNAKEKVSDDEVLELLKMDVFKPVFEGVYYRGGTNHPHTPGTMDNPYLEMTFDGSKDTDPSVRFVSHNIQNDYNLHVFTNDTIRICSQICKQVYNPNSTWGGAHDLFNVAWNQAGIERETLIDAFGVHMYHGIISPNRTQDRTDPRKVIEGERY